MVDSFGLAGIFHVGREQAAPGRRPWRKDCHAAKFRHAAEIRPANRNPRPAAQRGHGDCGKS